MKKTVFVIALIAGLVSMQTVMAEGTGLALGLGISEAAGNLGVSAEITSPSFARDFLMVRVESQADWLTDSAYASDDDIAGKCFSTHRLGLVGACGWCADMIRLYGEFGGILCLPADVLTDDILQTGIYGLFGFEFFVARPSHSTVALYLEAGTNNLFGTADELEGSPDYYSGFTTRTGFRYYF